MESIDFFSKAPPLEVKSPPLSPKRKLDDLNGDEDIANMRYKRINKIKADTKQINAETDKINAETKILRMQTFHDVTQQYISLCDPNLHIDERARFLFKNALIHLITSE